MKSNEKYIKPESEYYFYTASPQAKELFFYLEVIGSFAYESNYHLMREQYDNYLIMYIQQGYCYVTINNTQSIVRSGDLIFLNCQEPHAYMSDVQWSALWIHFNGILAHRYYQVITVNRGNIIQLHNAFLIEQILLTLYNSFARNNILCEAESSKYITDILTALILCRSPLEKYDSNARKIRSIAEYINKNYAKHLLIEELSHQASMSAFHFTRSFSKEIGISPHQYIIETRLNVAKFLLKTSTKSIKEIAFSCGFLNESTFCYTFKKKEELTPTQYRNLRN